MATTENEWKSSQYSKKHFDKQTFRKLRELLRKTTFENITKRSGSFKLNAKKREVAQDKRTV